MNEDIFNEFINSIKTLSKSQFDRLQKEVLLNKKYAKDDTLSEDELLMISSLFRKE